MTLSVLVMIAERELGKKKIEEEMQRNRERKRIPIGTVLLSDDQRRSDTTLGIMLMIKDTNQLQNHIVLKLKTLLKNPMVLLL